MKRLSFLLSAMLAALPAQAAQVRYDFAGSFGAVDFIGPAGGDLAAEAGLATGFSGYVIFDSAAADLDPDPAAEAYAASGFGLAVGGYVLPAGGEFVIAQIRPGSDFTLSFTSAGGFSAFDPAATLFLGLSFFEGIGPGLLQSPSLVGATADLILAGSDGSVLFGSGGVTRFDAAPIPEPASWALMIGGFALAGAAIRRRGARTVTA